MTKRLEFIIISIVLQIDHAIHQNISFSFTEIKKHYEINFSTAGLTPRRYCAFYKQSAETFLL